MKRIPKGVNPNLDSTAGQSTIPFIRRSNEMVTIKTLNQRLNLPTGFAIAVGASVCWNIGVNGNAFGLAVRTAFRSNYGMVKLKKAEILFNFHLTTNEDNPFYISLFPWKRTAKFTDGNNERGDAIQGNTTS